MQLGLSPGVWHICAGQDCVRISYHAWLLSTVRGLIVASFQRSYSREQSVCGLLLSLRLSFRSVCRELLAFPDARNTTCILAAVCRRGHRALQAGHDMLVCGCACRGSWRVQCVCRTGNSAQTAVLCVLAHSATQFFLAVCWQRLAEGFVWPVWRSAACLQQLLAGTRACCLLAALILLGAFVTKDWGTVTDGLAAGGGWEGGVWAHKHIDGSQPACGSGVWGVGTGWMLSRCWMVPPSSPRHSTGVLDTVLQSPQLPACSIILSF